jgi:hypothetical protein
MQKYMIAAFGLFYVAVAGSVVGLGVWAVVKLVNWVVTK